MKPSDIEDMANLGKAARACSYYASREALAAAEVVVLPYNTLLSPQARQSVGLSISNAAKHFIGFIVPIVKKYRRKNRARINIPATVINL